jgi:DivIVA domain-containing protein
VNKVQARGGKSMVLLPDEITNEDFSTVLGRGYDRREVDDFLMQVAASYKGAIEKIALVATGNQSTEDFSDEVELILRPARESAEEIVREAAEKTAGMHKAAAQRAAELEAEALERAKRIVEEALENADRRLEESRLQVARAEQAMHKAAAQRVAELEAEALERAKRIVEEAQENADRRLEESRLQVARSEQAMHEGLAERVAELEASGPLPRPDVALVRPTFREASQSGRPGRGRQTLILVGFGKALLSGLLIAEILYVLIAYFR